VLSKKNMKKKSEQAVSASPPESLFFSSHNEGEQKDWH